MNMDCCEDLRKAAETAAKHGMKLVNAKDTVSCGECHGTGEIGLADDDIPCPGCCGSGNPEKPGIWKYKDANPKKAHHA